MNPVKAFQYVYVIKNEKGLFYTGCTSDLRKRVTQHENKQSTHTKRFESLNLIYYEACLNKEDAYRRERYLKTGMGKRYLKNRLTKQLEKEL
jgi:putative endonuclease